jgi:hypothetical protein
MSFWIYRKDKNGKTSLWQIDIYIPFLITLVGLSITLILPKQSQMLSFVVWSPFVLLGAGLVLLLISKLSLYRKGIWVSFGSKQMSKTNATLYKTAYVFLGLGVLLLLLTWNALRRT